MLIELIIHLEGEDHRHGVQADVQRVCATNDHEGADGAGQAAEDGEATKRVEEPMREAPAEGRLAFVWDESAELHVAQLIGGRQCDDE